MPVSREVVQRYQQFFETLTDASIEAFRDIATPDVRYRDPLMDSKGIDAVVHSMHKWFKDLEGIRFEMKRYAIDDDVVFQHWTMSFRIKKLPKQPWCLEGMSKVMFSADGRVLDQVDYWDSAPMLQSVPVLGLVVKAIRGIFAH